MKFFFQKIILLMLLLEVSAESYSQVKSSSSAHSSAKNQRDTLVKDAEKQVNPFRKFIGEWTLKGDNWSQNWGQKDEHIKIPNHHTISKELNTDNSLLSIIDGTPPYGHIFWSYNPVKKEVYHLSSFGTIRSGVGKGSVNENGDVTLKISFEGEAEGTYRIYNYKWISDDEYEMKSIQYNSKGEPTGFFYGGIFIRIKQAKR